MRLSAELDMSQVGGCPVVFAGHAGRIVVNRYGIYQVFVVTGISDGFVSADSVAFGLSLTDSIAVALMKR